MKPVTAKKCGNPFFIVGAGRSGSTLLRVILNRHSLLCIPPESWFLLPLSQKFPFDRPLAGSDIDAACKIITGHRRWPDFGFDAEWFSHQVAEKQIDSIRGLCDLFFGLCLERTGKSQWGDKTPPYVQIVPEIMMLYPEARIIYLVRDGRDVANSFIDTRWHGPGAWANCREWIDATRRFASLSTNPNLAGRMLRIRYEDLVTRTEAVLSDICAFLGVDPEPSMLRWDEDEPAVVPERESHAHTKLGRRPRETDLYRWRNDSSAVRVLLLESYMRRELTMENYPLRFRSTMWLPLQGFIATLGPAAARLYRSMVWRLRSLSGPNGRGSN